ncbi:acetyltransferase (GNAT) family protein [Stackebrandtia endophytica]|uniref:Acetyltransferase (GNAT) family protein n=1 Tax=Stackebrandtia endophytica TaxID=1496996 RepID=A0A543AZ75_9ACTN|nr:GNAT family N-acetyltransferase [Stackebrandtia endophytica]TQL77878.1 acetyltransferase (GNAT) family protein [Stackebrandtia endophytica]
MTPRIDRVPYDGAVAQRMIALVQAEYVRRYGGEDATPLRPADFEPPHGGFFVCYLGEEPVATGAWRRYGAEDAEMKRLFVTESARGRGLARAMVAHLESDARAHGRTRMILESGSEQPEALALYASLGYRPVTPFGVYANEPGARHLGRTLNGADADISIGTVGAAVSIDGMAEPGSLM